MEAELAEKRNNAGLPEKRWNIKNILRFFCSAGVYIFLFFLVFVYSLYAPEGYIQIATNKYLFFRKLCLITAVVMIPLIILYYMMPPFKKRLKNLIQSISVTDIFIILFLSVNIISFYYTEYREEALWGTSGWYMGFGMQLFFIGIYFLISRFYDGGIDVLPFFMSASFIVFFWGLLNRFSIYPVDMHYKHEQFISSLGNVNWFCGFWSVFFVTGVVLYVITEKFWMRIFSGIYSVVALGLAAVEGSDSAFLSMGVVFLFLFLISFQKTDYMKRLLELGIFYCSACQVMRIIVKFDRESLSMDTTMMWIMLGNLTLSALIVLCAVRVFIGKREKEYAEKETAKGEWIWKYKWFQYTVIGIITGIMIIYIVLLIVNTRAPGSLGFLSKYSIFLFDGRWGSARGATWRDGLAIYQSFSWRERLFGAGQDCFSIYAYNIPELSARLQEEWPGSRLTNAHNECITHLVNVGIFGMLSFIGILWSSFKRLLERAAKDPLCYVFAAALLSYFVHNQFSFSQVLNTPYIYMMLGVGESLMRRNAKAGI